MLLGLLKRPTARPAGVGEYENAIIGSTTSVSSSMGLPSQACDGGDMLETGRGWWRYSSGDGGGESGRTEVMSKSRSSDSSPGDWARWSSKTSKGRCDCSDNARVEGELSVEVEKRETSLKASYSKVALVGVAHDSSEKRLQLASLGSGSSRRGKLTENDSVSSAVKQLPNEVGESTKLVVLAKHWVVSRVPNQSGEVSLSKPREV